MKNFILLFLLDLLLLKKDKTYVNQQNIFCVDGLRLLLDK
ncbi:hypothetical protein O59_001743 [Cellvibrio sp. BR]|nr:hypothetical protein O59_001743 [Cellvibrio sp. BR]